MTAAPVDITKPPPERPPQFRIVHLLIAMAVVAVVLGFAVPAWRALLEQEVQFQSGNNLKHMGVALHNYHDIYGTFPPAFVEDSAGNRMHSWRVLISAVIVSSSFNASYDFSQPWNAVRNQSLPHEALVSGCYDSPRDNSPPGMTNYVAIVGPGTMWPGEKGMTIGEITDGTSRTLMLVEVHNSNIHWMEPRDLPIEELEAWLNPKHQPTLAGTGGMLILRADASVEVLPPDATLKTLKAMITPAAGD
jgi:hypothetical protein